jgi:sRNA-binding protein
MEDAGGAAMTIVMERDDIERGVEVLSETYPKTFFTNGRLRRPLKVGIAKDIKADLAADPSSELKFYDIDQVLAWYTNHVGYQYACSFAGATRVALNGAKAGTVTESEAREAKERATEAFARIESRKRSTTWAAPANTLAQVALAAPVLKVLKVDSTLTNAELLASIEKHTATLKTLMVLPDPTMQKELSRTVVLLLINELKTLDARLTV